MRLLESLPGHLRMLYIRRDFPHVLNRIALAWADPAGFSKVMNALLIDDRGNRQGFPFGAMMELADLRAHYFREVRPDAAAAFDRSPPGYR